MELRLPGMAIARAGDTGTATARAGVTGTATAQGMPASPHGFTSVLACAEKKLCDPRDPLPTPCSRETGMAWGEPEV